MEARCFHLRPRSTHALFALCLEIRLLLPLRALLRHTRAHLCRRGDGAFPVAEALARETLSLPLFPGITDEELHSVVAGIRAYFDDG